MSESPDARIARLEEAVKNLGERMEERFDGLDARLAERCSGYAGRIESLEKGQVNQGKRIGELEAADNKRKGAWAAMLGVAGAAGAIGGAIVKFLWGQ
ncbi:hypothetical protein LJC46_04145 [Desulfovibrio sp. OttesenSCG-928-G15]|nr:hypothetical protein [Desulfovibrio sp. OttesenSCG-928-G15]